MSHGSSGLLVRMPPVPPILHRKKGNRGPSPSLLSDEFFDLLRTVQRGNFDLSAERRRRETDRHLAVQVVVVALKNRMGFDLDLHVKIACRPAIHPGLALAGKTDAIAI